MKNKSILKSLAVMLAISFSLVSVTATAISEEPVAIPAPTDRSEQFYVTQAESIRAYNDLLNNFNATFATENRQAATKQVYPDYYGGAYIDTSNGELVVMVVSEDFIPTLQSTYNVRSSNITYETCDISYNQLMMLYETINSKLEYFLDKNIEIISVSINEEKQEVLIEVIKLTTEKERTIRQILPNAFLTIKSSNEYHIPCAIGPGSPATDSGDLTSTVGFAATRSGTGGFIIAGHAGSIGDEFTSGRYTLGEITHSSYYNNSTADAAFITAESGLVLTYELANGGAIWSATTRRLPQNTSIYKFGIETELTSGRILAATHTFFYRTNSGDIYFYNCVKASYYSEQGDSGGPVMIYEGNYGGESRYTLCGICSAIMLRDLDDDGEVEFEYASYTPYSNIVDELGVSCIVGS